MSERISKRDFMKRLLGTGVLLATSSLPSLAKDDPDIFPKRGRFERLSVSFATVDIGLKQPFSVMHFSDTHLTAAYPTENKNKHILNKERTQTFGGRQEEALRDSLVWAKDHVDYVIHTGDLIDFQSEANFDLVKKYLGEGFLGTLGNHEYSIDMWLEKNTSDEKQKDKSRELLSSVYPFDISVYSQVVNGVNFIAFDNVYGTVIEKQAEFIKAEFKKGLPVVLCMHVPFYTDNIFRANHRFWSNEKSDNFSKPIVPDGEYEAQLKDPITHDLIKFLKKQKLLKAILTGHLHVTVAERFSKTAVQYVIGGNYGFNVGEVLFI